MRSDFLTYVPEYRRRTEQHRDGPTLMDVNGLGQWLAARARTGQLPNFTTLRELIDYLDGRCASPSIRRAALTYFQTYDRWRRAKRKEAA